MSASRTDLLAWLNELLQLNFTKIEQCGTGSAYVQIIDSIYGDLPVSRVKFNAKHEYEYLTNFKVLQNAFKAHKIDKPIPIDKLVKCKMQDNLEFLQWMKRFWDSNYGGQGYDAVGRRKGVPTETPATIAPLSSGRNTAGLTTSGATGTRAGGRTPLGGNRAASAQPNEAIQGLQTQLREMSTHLEGLEKERDFYFSKLRDIEILVQSQLDVLEAEGKEDEVLKEIQKILYSTEEGFEVPEGAPEAEGVLEEAAIADEEETF